MFCKSANKIKPQSPKQNRVDKYGAPDLAPLWQKCVLTTLSILSKLDLYGFCRQWQF